MLFDDISEEEFPGEISECDKADKVIILKGVFC